VRGVDRVFHFAAQVAVTTSLDDPYDDFTVNVGGTVRLLEALRGTGTPLLFTSTNKVYGPLADVNGDCFGISEERPLDFCTPYGCSKGAADQYVLDYAHSFGLPTVVFRMSCIYGPHQFGNEDQGWVAHFLIRALRGEPITIYGDGMQVRDILFVEDLADAFLLAQANMDNPAVRGHAFNIGGSPANTISLHDLLDHVERLHGARPEVRFGPWRPGDQRYYVSDVSKMQAATEWRPRVGVREGVARLDEWLRDNVAKPRRRIQRVRAALPGKDAWSVSREREGAAERKLQIKEAS
jgi:CDP-paratose 2-epimerase